jgi:hypothetical protein
MLAALPEIEREGPSIGFVEKSLGRVSHQPGQFDAIFLGQTTQLVALGAT